MKSSVRLQKYIADCGITSRRKAEDLIVQGRVKVNQMVVTQLGTTIIPKEDLVFVDNQLIDREQIQPIYMIMHKPRAYVTTLSDPEGRYTVMDLCPDITERIYPIGRLDYLSEGLLIMTNDGHVANMVMHPKFNISKVYEVKVFGVVGEELLKKLRDGVTIDGVSYQPRTVRIINQLRNKTWLEFRLYEGKNREIRIICDHNGVTIDKLKRVAIGNLTITGLAPGKYKMMSKKQLLQAIGIDEQGNPLDGVSEYFSHKKSLKIKPGRKHFYEKAKSANDNVFYKFRKGYYYDSMTSFKKIKTIEKTSKKTTPARNEKD